MSPRKTCREHPSREGVRGYRKCTECYNLYKKQFEARAREREQSAAPREVVDDQRSPKPGDWYLAERRPRLPVRVYVPLGFPSEELARVALADLLAPYPLHSQWRMRIVVARMAGGEA